MDTDQRVNWQALLEATIIPPVTRFPWEEAWEEEPWVELENAEWSGLGMPTAKPELVEA